MINIMKTKMIMVKSITKIRQRDRDVEIEANIQNEACLSKTMSICNKQRLRIFESQLIKKLSNSEAESKKALLIKKACSSPKAIPINKTKIKSFSSMSSQLEAHSQSPFCS